MTIQMTPFLRKTLLADAAMGAGAAVLTIAGSTVLAPLLELPAGLIFWAGVALVPIAIFLFAMARRPQVPRAWLAEIVLINAAWTVASFAILVTGMVQPNLLGAAFVIAQGLAVGLFALLEAAAMRTTPSAASA